MDGFFIFIASTVSGVCVVLKEKFVSYRNSIGLFLMGFGFCWASAGIAQYFGFDTQVSSCIGYIFGILSKEIYGALCVIVSKIPEFVEKVFNKFIAK